MFRTAKLKMIPTAPDCAKIRAGVYVSRGPIGEFGSEFTYTILAKDRYWEIRKSSCHPASFVEIPSSSSYAGWGWSLSDSLSMIEDGDV
jgi:hypothetical protein